MKKKRKTNVSIIGGADGPTSIFIADKTEKRSVNMRIRNGIFKLRRKMIARRVRANAHTLRAVVAFMRREFGAVEISRASQSYRDQKNCLKESLIIKNRPELLGSLSVLEKPVEYNEESLREMFEQIQRRSELAAQVPDELLPMDFHIYKILRNDKEMEIGIDFKWDIFGVSYSGNKKTMREFRRISRRLYSYYGVTEEDIKNNTERYSSLLTVLASE